MRLRPPALDPDDEGLFVGDRFCGLRLTVS
jgi:hypothetical protein